MSGMIEYRVRVVDTDGAADVEQVCNGMARDGWRLVSTSVENIDPVLARVWLFFEREVSAEEIARAAIRFASTATR